VLSFDREDAVGCLNSEIYQLFVRNGIMWSVESSVITDIDRYYGVIYFQSLNKEWYLKVGFPFTCVSAKKREQPNFSVPWLVLRLLEGTIFLLCR
jgi:hypothetical protein